jgi:hypothetical protein
MKDLMKICICLWLFSCNYQDKHNDEYINAAAERKALSAHSITTKAANVQACLDSIIKDREFGDFTMYKFILIKNEPYTTGLDRLHLGKNKLQLAEVSKGLNVHEHDPNKDDNNTVYMAIKYVLKDNTSLDIHIELYYYNDDWLFKLVKKGDEWKIDSMRHEISY